MQIIPLQPSPNQAVQVTLGGQDCTLAVYQKSTGLYLDLTVGTTLILAGVICQNLNRVVRDAYLGFVGDLCFQDTQGQTDPVFTGLGSRYQLLYLELNDLKTLGLAG